MLRPRPRTTGFAAATLLPVACLVSACGSAAHVSAPADGDAGSVDAGSAAEAPPPPPPPPTCNIQITGSYESSASGATAYGDLEQGSAGFECSWRQGPASVTVSVAFPDAPSLGLHATTDAYVDIAQPGGAAGFSGSCTVDVLAFAPASKGGMRARLSCPSLSGDGDLTGTSFFGTVSVSATVDLPPARPPERDAGETPDADAAAAKPTCTMAVHGAYEASGSGEGDNDGCLVSVAGTSFYVEPFAPAGPPTSERMEVSGDSWCTSCLARYYAAPACTYSIILDEGVRGRFVATYDCEGLVAGDGSVVGASGSIDGVHQPPPE
jgi:hypothetical protein